jgi:FMN phosphatase YigB (HAD superfamily)
MARFGSSLDAVLLRAENVLYDATLWRRWLLQVLSRMGLYACYDTFFWVWQRDFLPEVHAGRRDLWESLAAFLRTAGMSSGQVDEVLAACRPRYRHYRNSVRTFAGVHTTLQALRDRGTRVGVLNHAVDTPAEFGAQLNQLALHDCFDVVICSTELGVCEADGLGFQVACRRLRSRPTRTALVSNDPVEISTAARLGFFTVGFNNSQRAPVDASIDRFSDMLQFVGRSSLHQQAS